MGVKLRRGFKSEAEAYACEFRQELKLLASAPLDMFVLARHLEIPVIALSNLQDAMSATSYQLLTKPEKKPFSAVTLFRGRHRSIIYNDSNSPARQQSDLAHELAHAILDHPPSSLTNESGGRHYNKELEEEAACLSGVLLVPLSAAMWILKSGKTLESLSDQYNISTAMLRMRTNKSGARTIMSRINRA